MRDSARLHVTWGLIVGATVISVAFGVEAAGPIATVAALALSWVKARLVLDHFLDLRLVAGGWRDGLLGGIALMLAVVLGLGLIGPLVG